MSTPRRTVAAPVILTAIVASLLLSIIAWFGLASSSSSAPVTDAWQRARASGRYDFHTEVVQRTSPLPVLENVGLSSREDRYYLMGTVDLPAGSLDLRLWAKDGSAATGTGGLAIRIEGGKAFGRTDSGDWQELDGDVSGAFAPSNDPLGFLVAARNVRPAGVEQRAGVSYTRYTFDLSGPAFARYMREHVEDELRRQGKLPVGASLQDARAYTRMTGAGELWVGDNGLPLRQVVTLAIPDTYRPQTVDATISTDFSNFDQGLAGLVGLPRLAQVDWRGLGAGMATVATVLGFAAMLIVVRRSRPLYLAVAGLTVLSLVVMPVAQGLQMRAFAAELGDQAAAARQSADEAQQAARYEAEQARLAFNPTISPLAQAGLSGTAAAPDDGADSDGDGLSNTVEGQLKTSPTVADSDGDGLSDGIEARELGTSPLTADSDGDKLSDSFEVRGFVDRAGKRWYLNPLASDTNHDSVPDSFECATSDGICPDTNGDGTPDLFDLDNDGDGVPDSLDAAPSQLVAGQSADGSLKGLDNQLLSFRVNNTTAQEELFVDFQLRPLNASHLWYSFNVLDWPSNDREGQIRRVSSSTFDTIGKGANGDIRLVPVLEIEIPYKENTFAALPTKANVREMPRLPNLNGKSASDYQAAVSAWFADWLNTDKLTSLGISVRLKNTNRDLIVQVPLTLVRDPDTDTPVAFSGRMLYRPDAAGFNGEHNARLAWVLQAKQDSCTATPDAASADAEAFNRKAWEAQSADTRGTYKAWKDKSDADRYDTWCADASHWVTSEGAANTYYDDWYLTALTVREDQRVSVATLLQNPRYYNGTWGLPLTLSQLADRLSTTFLAGDKAYQIESIARNLDSRSNSGTSESDRLEFPQDAFVANRVTFTDQAELGRLATELNSKWLTDVYLQNNGTPSVTIPTMLFLREEQYRQLTLSAATTAADKRTLIIDIGPEKAPVERSVAMSWSPYRHVSDSCWEAYPLEEYWKKLQDSYSQLFRSATSPYAADARTVAGATELARMQHLTLQTGLAALVERDGRPVQPEAPAEAEEQEPPEIAEPAKAIVEKVQSMAEAIAEAEFKVELAHQGTAAYAGIASAFAVVNMIGGLSANGEKSEAVNSLLGATTKMLALGVSEGAWASTGTLLLQGATAGLSIFLSLELFGATNTLSEVTEAIEYTAAGLEVFAAAKGVWDAVSDAKELFKDNKITSWFEGSMANAKNSAKIAAAIMLAIDIGVAVGLFIYQMVSSGTKFASLQFNQAMAKVAATIMVSVFMTVLSLAVPIGSIIAAVIGAIDALIAGICKWTGAENSSNTIVKDYVCAGISGLMTKLVEFLIYSQNPFVDLDAADRLNPTNWDLQPKDPRGNQGQFQVGGYLEARADAVTRLTRTGPNSLLTALWGWEYLLDSNVTASTFRYDFTATKETGDQQIHSRLRLHTGAMPQVWREDGDQFTTTQRVSSQDLIKLDTAGINWRPTFYLAEGYAVLTHECTWIPILTIFVPTCWKRDKTDSVYLNMSQSFAFDVFPATLDGFYALTDRGNGSFALAWDAGFPALKDADGDGLRSRAAGGNDPNDNAADSDGDGLSDFYEVKHANQGFDPNRPDTDDDGLADRDEVRAGTRPALADSDNDGLGDGDELAGWEIVYDYDSANNPIRTRVFSDPLLADVDGDKITDSREKIYGFNPRIANDANILSLVTAIDERDGANDGIVADGREIGYTVRITNNLRDRYAAGLLEVGIPAGASNVSLRPRVYTLSPRTSTGLDGTIRIADLSSSEKVKLINRAGALIADLRSRADGRVTWLHFDETDSVSSFADDSTLGNVARCVGAGCPQANQDGYMGRALRFTGPSSLEIAHRPSLAGLGRFTLSLWVNPATSASGDQVLLSKQAGPGSKLTFNLALTPRTNQVRLITQGASCSAGSGVTLTGAGGLPAGQWSHVLALYDGARYAIYVNGALDKEERTSKDLCANEAPIRIGSGAVAGTLIDELSLYPRGLLSSEVGQFFRAPLIDLDFDGSVADRSSLRQRVSTGGNGLSYFPIERGGSRVASFDQTRWISASGSLDLSRGTGQFSAALWIKPEATSGQKLAVFGRESGDTTYPSLYYMSDGATGKAKLQLDFGSGSALCTSLLSNALLTEGAWQHLAVAYTGDQFVFYINGKRAQALPLNNCAPGSKPAPSSDPIWIGRASRQAHVTFTKLVVSHDGDGSGGAEYYLDFDTSRIWRHDASSGAQLDLSSLSRDINDDGQHSFRLMEEDSGSDDDLEVERRFNNYPRAFEEARYTADGEGWIGWSVSNEFYRGDMDTFQLYGYAMGDDQARELYRSQTQALAISFDDPPGTSTFVDSSGNSNSGLCSGGSCPTSGIAGRSGQAARFDGADDVVIVTNNTSFQTSQGYSVAAWVRLDDPSRDQKIISKYADNGTLKSGYMLGVRGGKLYAQIWDAFGRELSVEGGSIRPNTWTHLALTASFTRAFVDGTLQLTGSVDGFEVGRAEHSGLLGVTPSDATAPVTIGRASGNWGWAGGMIDEVAFFTQPLSPEQLADLVAAAPVIHMGFDEALGSTSFANNADPNQQGSCSGAACPQSGLKGQIRDAVVFNEGSMVGVPNLGASTAQRFSLAMWVNPKGSMSREQVLAGQGGSQYAYRLSLDAGSLKLVGQLRTGVCGDPLRLVSNRELNKEMWNHVAMTFDGAELRLYLNGTFDSTIPVTGAICRRAEPLMIAGGPGGVNFFSGALDEVALYHAPLSTAEIKAIYSYQNAWFDVAIATDLTIDADDPVVRLDVAPDASLPNRDTLLAIYARDQTSDITRVEVSAGRGWQPVSQDDGVWIFTYDPLAAGDQIITMRAYDRVGHSTTTTSHVWVDGVAPSVAISPSLSSQTLPALSGSENLWTIDLSGEASDDKPGPVHVLVSLLDSNGGTLGQPLALEGVTGAWSGSYQLPFPPNGAFTVRAVATDRTDNSASAEATIRVDATPASAEVTLGTTALGGTGAGLPVLHGTASDIFTPEGASLHLTFEESGGATAFLDGTRYQYQAICAGSACPSTGRVGHLGAAVAFDGSDDTLTIDLDPRRDGSGVLGLDPQPFTVATWVHTGQVNGHTVISAARDGSEVLQIAVTNGGGRINAWGALDGAWTALAQGDLEVDTWNHVAISFDGQTFRTYVNGVQTYAFDPPSKAFRGFNRLWVGSHLGAGEYLQGVVDEVLVYRSALGAEQINRLVTTVTSPITQVEVGLLHVRDRDDPAAIQWQPATLSQSGQPFTTWSAQVPAGLEGPYQVWLRTADALGSQTVSANVWGGDIDTLAPRVSFDYLPVSGGAARIACEASDYNLIESEFVCPAPRSGQWQFSYQSAPWFVALLSSTDALGLSRPAPQKLERISTGTITLSGANNTMRACDSFGNCTSLTRSQDAGIQAATGASAVITPTLPQVFTNLSPITIQGYVRAEDGLQSLDVTLGGSSIYTEGWSNNEVEDTWSANYTPTAEGIFALQATLRDRNSVVITDTASPKLYVDLTPPELSLSTTGFGTADTLPGGFLVVSGLLTESVALQRLELRLGDDPWQDIGLPAMPAAATPFSATLASGISAAFDGQSFTVAVRATDIAGRVAEVSRALVADSTPPTLGAVSLEYQRSGSPVAITPGATVSDVSNPSLSIRWAPATDNGGIARYFVGWTTSPTPTLASLSAYGPAASVHAQSFGDVRRLWAHIVAEDTLGNRAVQTLGPIYVDHGLTPAYISMDEFGLPYRGYMTDACSQIGLDNRVSWQAQGDTGQNQPQQLYLTWNASDLRMTWTGASWDTDGDLFIYLDTQPGAGSNQAYDPFPATSASTTMLLPQRAGSPIGADFLVWVQDSQTASLLRWDGAAWQPAPGAWSIVVDPNMASPHTDIDLPFATLGIASPATAELGLLALASEEGQLRTWATMPPNNSLTSERIVSRGTMPDQLTLRLRNAYLWAGLGDGVCPRGLDARVAAALSLDAGAQADQPLQFSGADVSVRLSASFPGTISGFFGDNLYFLGDGTDGSAAGLGADTGAALPSLGDGDVVTYTLRFLNRGSGPSTGLTFLARSAGSLRLVGGAGGGTELRLSAGDLAAGAEGTLTFQARMDKAALPPNTFRWDSLSVVAYDATGTPTQGWIDQITAEHQIDSEPPRHIEISKPRAVLGAGRTIFRGTVTDYSAVPTIALQVSGGATVTCDDPTPQDHSWECPLDLGAAAEGAQIEVRAQATDEHGQTGAWSNWERYVVDTTAPSVSLDAGTLSALADGLVGPSEATLSGVISDNRLPDTVLVCDPADGSCAQASLELDPAALGAAITVVDQPATPIALAGIPACGAGALTRDLAVADELTVDDVNLGLTTSGVRHGQIQVALTSPAGRTATLIAARAGGKGQGYNMTLDDSAALLERDDTSSHEIEPPFAAAVAPFPSKLALFDGEPARGTWQLAICNGSGGTISGTYVAASLALTPRATPADASATWRYSVPIPEGSDGVARQLRIYGVDSAGNTSQASAIERTVSLDNVAPTLTIDDVSLATNGLLALAGDSSDSSPITTLRLALRAPSGEMTGAVMGGKALEPALAGAATPWSYTASQRLVQSGIYKLWVEAEDAAGNTTIIAADDLNWINPALSGGRTYLPFVAR